MTKTREDCYAELKRSNPDINELDGNPYITIEGIIDAMIMLDSDKFKNREIVDWEEQKDKPKKRLWKRSKK